MTTEPNPAPSKIIPNTFQTPNALASDRNSIMSVLTGNEVKCYVAIVRKIFGWGKQSDRIPKKQIMNITGLGEEAVETCMAALVGYGLVLRVAENHPKKNYGVEWALQTDDTRIRWDLLFSRVEERKDKRKKAASSYKGVTGGGGNTPLPENTPHGGGVYQPNQKPLSKANRSSHTTGEIDFSALTVEGAYKVPTLAMYRKAAGFFPGQITWEFVDRFIRENGITAEQIKTAAIAWALRGHKQSNVEGILEWAKNGVPASVRSNPKPGKKRRDGNDPIENVLGGSNGN